MLHILHILVTIIMFETSYNEIAQKYQKPSSTHMQVRTCALEGRVTLPKMAENSLKFYFAYTRSAYQENTCYNCIVTVARQNSSTM